MSEVVFSLCECLLEEIKSSPSYSFLSEDLSNELKDKEKALQNRSITDNDLQRLEEIRFYLRRGLL